MEFRKYNANPKGNKTGDCVIRAITMATNYKWEEVYEILAQKGLSKCKIMIDKEIYEEFLKEEGWEKHKMPRFRDNTRYQVRELIDEKPKCSMIISVANHMTYAEKGTLIDTWDCSRKSVGNYWTKEN